MTSDSVGPSTIVVTVPKRCTSTCAQVTAGLPGPTTSRTFGIDSVPSASAAMPAGPFTRNTSRRPSNRHAASTAGSTDPWPPGSGGTTTTTLVTPATSAGTASWTSTEGNEPLPLGTNRPADSTGVT